MNEVIWGVDYGTTNIAIAGIDPQHTQDVCSVFYKLDNKCDPFDLHKSLENIVGNLPRITGERHVVYIEKAILTLSPKTFERMTRVAHSLHILFNQYGYNGVELIDNNTWKSQLLGTSRVTKDEANAWAIERWPMLTYFKASERGHRADSLCIAEAGRNLNEKHLRIESG